MASLYNAAAAKGKRKATEEETSVAAAPKNKQRVLILPSRGVTMRMRHLVNDLEALLPHSKKGEL
jgi:ribosome biogenesis protein BRX1